MEKIKEKIKEEWKKEDEDERAEKWIRRKKHDYLHFWIPKSLLNQIRQVREKEILEEVEELELVEYQGNKISAYLKRSSKNKEVK